MTPTFRAVVFDFFGTLTEAIPAYRAPAAVAAALGCDAGAVATLFAQTYPARARGEYGDAAAETLRLARMLGTSPAPEQVAAAVHARSQAIRASIRLRSDAIYTLWTLKHSGLSTGLVSDCTCDVPALVSDLPIANLIDAMIFSVHLGVSKPNPLLFLTACERLDVPPGECLYVGDGGGRELSGARAAGMAAVRLVVPDLARHLAHDSEPDWDGPTVESLHGVLAMIAGDRTR